MPKKNQVSKTSEEMIFFKQSLAYIEIRVDDSEFQFTEIPFIHPPALLDNQVEKEFVYPIFDYGDRLISSKASETLFSGQSMLKMYYTIDKMISIWYEKIKSIEQQGGRKTGSGEVKIYLDGFDLCLRKAFEAIINIADNWIIMNYDPGDWGNRYLDILQKLNEKGYPYPPPAPRDYYRHTERHKKTKNVGF